MKNPAAYQPIQQDSDWAQEIAQLDWHRRHDITTSHAAAMLNEAISEQYGNVAEFQNRLCGRGFAESVAAGKFMRETLEHAPPEFQPDIIAAALDQAGASQDGIILAYRRDYIDLDGLSWNEPDPALEHSLEQAAGHDLYQEILLARETMRHSAYLCATPGEFGPNNETHFLDLIKVSYDDTLAQEDVTPQQILESVDLAYRRISYVTRRHLDSFRDRMPAEHPAASAIEAMIANLDGAETHWGVESLHATAVALAHATALDGTVPDAEALRFKELARLAGEAHHLTEQRAPEHTDPIYEYLHPRDSVERLSYETIERIRNMGYHNEMELVDAIASDDWNQTCRGLQDLNDAIQDPMNGYAITRYITDLTQKYTNSDGALARYQLLQNINTANDGPAYYTTETADALEGLQAEGVPELAVKLDRMLRHSSEINILRIAHSLENADHTRAPLSVLHLHYNDLVSTLPDIITTQGLLQDKQEQLSFADRASHEVNRMEFRLMSEIRFRLVEQYSPNGRLLETAERRHLDAAVIDKVREFQDTEQLTADEAATWPLHPENVEWLATLTTMKLAMQHAIESYDNPELLTLLDSFNNDWNNPDVQDQALQMLHPMIQHALGAAKDVATSWSFQDIADGETGYPVRYADIGFHETDGGREQWLHDSPLGYGRDLLTGDCTVRALAAAIGRPEAYGEIWAAVTERQRYNGYDNKDADQGSRPSEFQTVFAEYGVFEVYTDSQLPIGYARRELDLREVPAALHHLYDNSGEPLVYIVSTLNHNVAIVDDTLNDHADTRYIGDDALDGNLGRIAKLWVKSNDPDTIEAVRTTFDQYARVRAHSAA